jgi:hypothetical protein
VTYAGSVLHREPAPAEKSWRSSTSCCWFCGCN